MSSDILLSLEEVQKYLVKDKKCKTAQKKEVIQTLENISSTKGRRWTFVSEDDKYYIDEYNEYSDFVKTYTFTL